MKMQAKLMNTHNRLFSTMKLLYL